MQKLRKPKIGPVGEAILGSIAIVGIISVVIAFWALSKLKDTYHKELGYVEMM